MDGAQNQLQPPKYGTCGVVPPAGFEPALPPPEAGYTTCQECQNPMLQALLLSRTPAVATRQLQFIPRIIPRCSAARSPSADVGVRSPWGAGGSLHEPLHVARGRLACPRPMLGRNHMTGRGYGVSWAASSVSSSSPTVLRTIGRRPRWWLCTWRTC
jgi:hypothetical protein